jgi:hypothetical protein
MSLEPLFICDVANRRISAGMNVALGYAAPDWRLAVQARREAADIWITHALFRHTSNQGFGDE